MMDQVLNICRFPGILLAMSRTDARLVARLHVDHGHVSSAVCMRG
jgi:hypothetical protein